LPRGSNLPLVFSAGLNDSSSTDQSLYYSATLQYSLPAETTAARDEGISVYAQIQPYIPDTLEGSGALSPGKNGSLALKAATTYLMTLHISTTMDRDYLALRVPVPSGSEILNSVFVSTSSAAESINTSSRPATRREIMKNEVRYFWNSFPKGQTEMSFLFRPLRPGIYPTPPAQAECMYQSEIFGRSDGVLYTVSN
jgi:hypothetical protein